MARPRIELERADDFTGGLNVRDDPFSLAKGETFELQNVDVGRRGGFSLRRGLATFINTASGMSPSTRTTYTFVNAAGTRRIMGIGRDFRCIYWDGAAWQQIKAATAGTFQDSKCVEMRNEVYIICALAVPHKWDGVAAATTALAALGPSNDLAAPNEGNFPQCHTAAVFAEAMFAGNMVNDFDGAVNRPSRVRWSHPGKPEDWRAVDWIDLDPDDESGEIRAMVPYGDRLLVFKDHAVYAINGAPPAALELNNLTKKVGCSFNGAVTVTEQGVYFWDTRTGAWFYDGSEFHWVFERLYPLIDDGIISTDPTVTQSLAFHNQRLYCVVNWTTTPYDEPGGESDVALVYDPYAGKEGAWMIHANTWQDDADPFDIITTDWPKALHVHVGADGAEHLLGTPDSGPWVFEIDTPNKSNDDMGHGVVGTHEIPAFYTTRWFDAGITAQKKRWKRPIVVMRGGLTQTTNVEVLADYDPTTVDRTFNLNTTVDTDDTISSWMELNGLDEVAYCVNDTFNPGVAQKFLIGVDMDPTTIGPAIQTLASDWATDAGLELGRYLFQIDGAGFLRLIRSPDGTAGSQTFETATVPLPDANRRTVWVEFDPDNGANRETKFYTSTTLTGTKVQLGATVLGAITTNFNGGFATQIGLHGFGGTEEFTGNVYAAEFRYDGIGGTLWGQPNFSNLAAGTDNFEDEQGNTWELDSGATIISSVISSDQGIWDTDSWDTFLWARETALHSERSVILRGPPLGGGVARALRFRNMTQDQPWRVHGLTMKWIPRKIRN